MEPSKGEAVKKIVTAKHSNWQSSSFSYTNHVPIWMLYLL